MYRVSDGVCAGPDAAPVETRDARLKQRWDCLSKEASDEVCTLDSFQNISAIKLIKTQLYARSTIS